MDRLPAQPGLTEQVYKSLLDEICDGRLAPGAHLVQEALAEALGVSRQPIQQALALLRNDGLVQELGRRGLFVAPLDLETMRQHYEVRAALDGIAARRAAERAAASAALAAQMKQTGAEILAAGRAAVADGATAALVQRDVEFHGFVYESSGNPVLASTAEFHWRYLRRVMSEVLRRAEPPPAIWRQHQDILGAIVRGDAEAAERLARAHVDHASSRLAQAIAEGDAASGEDGGRWVGPAAVTVKQSRSTVRRT